MVKTAIREDLIAELQSSSTQPDQDLGLAHLALIFAALEQPGVSIERYESHLKRLVQEAADHFATLEKDTLGTRVESLRHILAERYNYKGDADNYDDLQNASLIRVIDRARGLPIALSILYIHVARALGWEIDGLNIPGHFLVRLDREGERVILDPFDQGAEVQAADIRRFVKQALGPQAELSATYYEPADNRTILIRLQNNIKIRQIEQEDYEGAARTVEAMRVFVPDEYRLLLDAGVLYARINRPQNAIEALEAYIDLAPHSRDRQEAAMLLQQIRQTLP